MFETVRVAVLFGMFLNPGFKMTASFGNIATITANTRNNTSTRRDFKSPGTGSLYDK